MDAVRLRAFSFGVLRYAYDNTAQGAPVLKLRIDSFLWRTSLNWFEKDTVRTWLLSTPDAALDFTLELARRMNLSALDSPFRMTAQEYFDSIGMGEDLS